MDIKALDKEHIAETYARLPLLAQRGKGATIYDEAGKEYIDLGSGIGVNAFGACDEAWISAVTAQLHQLQHLSNLYYTEPQARLAALLCEKTGMKKVFFTNSGAEANECAIKAARKYSFDRYGEGRGKIITLENSFHGRTLATLTATGQEAMHRGFSPLLPGFAYVPAGDFEALAAACTDDVCAVMLELIQGEGGVNPLEPDFVAKTAEFCKQRDILLIIDEVQTGNGRTGALYAYMDYALSPDLVTTAKGLGNGLPIGCCLFGERTEKTFSPGDHGSTYGGNPVCAAGAISVISRLDEDFLAEVRAKGEALKAALEGIPGVLSVHGRGLMLGIEIDQEAKAVVAACLEQGLILLTAKKRLRLLPPLNISNQELEKAISIMKGVMTK